MTTRVEAAVLVLAAGAGTRMRSDTPKVLHTLAGRSMLSHALHAVAKVGPATPGRGAGPRPRAHRTGGRAVGRASGPTDRHRGAGATARHRPRRRLRPGRAARRLRRHRRGHLGRRPAAGRRHAGRPDRHAQRRAGRRHRAHHDAARPDRLRPRPAHPGRGSHRHRRAGRCQSLRTGHPGGQRRRLCLRHRPAALGAEPAAAAQRAAGAVFDRRHRRSSDPTASAFEPNTSTTARWPPASTTGCSSPN